MIDHTCKQVFMRLMINFCREFAWYKENNKKIYITKILLIIAYKTLKPILQVNRFLSRNQTLAPLFSKKVVFFYAVKTIITSKVIKNTNIIKKIKQNTISFYTKKTYTLYNKSNKTTYFLHFNLIFIQKNVIIDYIF